ncbi:MAG: pentapeptide repeat-containing protein, partial [Thermoproteota archaeon]
MSNNELSDIKADFVIITAIQQEYDAVKKIFQLQDEKSLQNILYCYGELNGYPIICMRCTDRGNISSNYLTTRIIQQLKPRYLILVGIAGGVIGRDNVQIGDIVFSSSVEYYQYVKRTEKGERRRVLQIAQPSPLLRKYAALVKNWWNRIKSTRPDGKEWNVSKAIEGLILSGETIWDDPESEDLKRLLNEYDKALAFETEAGGVARAIYESESSSSGPPPGYIVIRGISDPVNKKGGPETREKWRTPAAEAAAAFAYELITLVQRDTCKLDGRFVDYLDFVMKSFTDKKSIDDKSLSDYYVENRTLLTNVETWDLPDHDVKGMEWKADVFLNGPRENWYIVIGAPFGMGKTTFTNYLAWKLARKIIEEKTRDDYIPVIVKLGGLEKISEANVFHKENVGAVLEIIAGNNKSRKILLILDGLDEFRGKINELLEEARNYHNKYPNLKVIITTRLKAGVPEELKIEEYVRLLPFNAEKVDEFFKKYGVDLTFDECKSFGLKEEEISKPLLCWMLAMMFTNPIYRVEFKPEWPNEARRTFLYYIFIHSLLRGKYKFEYRTSEFKQYYLSEKEMLRIIAAMKNVFGENLTEKRLYSLIKNMELKYVNKEEKKDLGKFLEPLLTSYFYLSSSYEETSRRIDFIHESFKEYLLAEYYYESIRDGKAYRLNVGEPSPEAMYFLKGLIDIAKSDDMKQVLRKIDDQLFISDNDVQELITKAKEIVENESIIFRKSRKKSNKEEREIWKRIEVSTTDFVHLWLHRWISLNILSWIRSKETINKESIEHLIGLTSYFTSSHLKNLTEADLSGARLIRADLSGANLFRARLIGANLSEARLIGANLSEARLIGANLSGANLSEARLIRADLSEADLSEARLIRADLSGANLFGARLIGANLSEARLIRADLSGANLFGARLI